MLYQSIHQGIDTISIIRHYKKGFLNKGKANKAMNCRMKNETKHYSQGVKPLKKRINKYRMAQKNIHNE